MIGFLRDSTNELVRILQGRRRSSNRIFAHLRGLTIYVDAMSDSSVCALALE